MSAFKTLKNIVATQWVFVLFRIGYNYILWMGAKVLWYKYIKKRINKRNMFLKTYDNGISRALMLLGMRELETYYMLEKTIQPGDIIFDLWANIWYYVLLEHTLLDGTGYIYAVEPEPDNYALLNKNIVLNKLENVEAIHGAISDHDGSIDLYLSDLSNVHSIFDNHEHGTWKIISVPSLALSTFIKDRWWNIDLIRMDIEWAEILLFQDLVQNFTKDDTLPSIMFEIHGDKYEEKSIQNALEWLLSLWYRCRFFATSRLEKRMETTWYIYEKEIFTDGFTRYVYANIANKDFIEMISIWRAALLVKE